MFRRYRGGNVIGSIILILFVFMAFAQAMIGLSKVSVPLVIFLGFCLLLIVIATIQGFRRGWFDDLFVPSKQIVSRQEVEVPMRRDTPADRAIYRAGYVPNDNPDIQLADIGILVYDGTKNPKICRSSAVPTDAIHIRPFIVLNMPYLADPGTDVVIRFYLVDESGKSHFQTRSRFHVKQGQNFITPKTWLPLADKMMDGVWSLQVCMGDTPPFAIHEFGWLEVGGEIRTHFNGDGEIDELMQPAIIQSAEEPMSIDELLEEQTDEAPLVMDVRR